ncbi:MAG: cadherin-like domain-containing protein, partial [Planctomycetales bacterium]|nr:cadherin-like domain-containing protein [Planctomycetales bacterium]
MATRIRKRIKLLRSSIEQLETRRLLAGTPYSDLVDSYAPVGYWRLSEPSGTTAIDEVAVSNGVYKNGVTLGASGVESGDTAASFDGVDDIVEVPHDAGYLAGNGTLAIWFQASTTSGRHGIFSKDSSGKDTGGHMSMMVDNGSLRLRSQSTTQSQDLYAGTAISPNTWHLAVVTWGSSGLALYVDGSQSATAPSWTTGLVGNYEPIVVGGLQWYSGNLVADRIDNPFAGQIDEVAIFNSVLSPTQIQMLYDTATGTPQNTPPVAVDDNASTAEDTLVTTANVLLNDSDGDGDTLFVSGFDAVSSQGGTVVSNGNGTFNYTPALNFNGSDSFTYDVSDGNGGTDTATVTI